MSLGLNLSMTTLDLLSTGDLVFTDVTGSYDDDAVKYPNGYGNPSGFAREDVALFLRVHNKRTSGDTLVTLDSYDPETVLSWRGEYLKQGVYATNLKAVQKFEQDINDERFAVDEIVYDFSANSLLRITEVTEDDGTYTFTTTSATEDDLFSGNYTQAARATQFKTYFGELKSAVASLNKTLNLTPRESPSWDRRKKDYDLANGMLETLCNQAKSIKSYDILVKNVETAEEYFQKHFSHVL